MACVLEPFLIGIIREGWSWLAGEDGLGGGERRLRSGWQRRLSALRNHGLGMAICEPGPTRFWGGTRGAPCVWKRSKNQTKPSPTLRVS